MDALSRLLAIEDIKQLKARYFRFLDSRDYDAMAMVFCRDAVFDSSEGPMLYPVGGAPVGQPGPVTRGRDEIMAWISGSFATRVCVHHGHGHEVTLDSETEAHGVIAMEDMIYALDRQTLLIHAAGHYHERYRVEDGQWRIAQTKLTRLMRTTPGQ
jgi:hypothetical protein